MGSAGAVLGLASACRFSRGCARFVAGAHTHLSEGKGSRPPVRMGERWSVVRQRIRWQPHSGATPSSHRRHRAVDFAGLDGSAGRKKPSIAGRLGAEASLSRPAIEGFRPAAPIRVDRCRLCHRKSVPGVAWTPQTLIGGASPAWVAMTTVRLITSFPPQRAQSGARRVGLLNFSAGSGSIQGFSAPQTYVCPGPDGREARGRK